MMARHGIEQQQFNQRGFTLIELMISLTLGLLVMLVASAALVMSNGAYLHQGDAMRVNDGARYAGAIMARAIRQSAFVNRDGLAVPVGAAPEDSANISGLDARSVSRDTDGIDGAPGTPVNGSDVLALRYAGAGTGAGGDGSVINCAGFGVPAPASAQERGWSIFYVAYDSDGEAELRCKYRGQGGWNADAIVRGVDSFQVLYGLDTDVPADGVANQYVNATALAALDNALLLNGVDAAARTRDLNQKTWWKRVRSVRIALLLHGDAAAAPEHIPQQFDLFGQDYGTAFGAADPGVRISEAGMPKELRSRVRKLIDITLVLRNDAR